LFAYRRNHKSKRFADVVLGKQTGRLTLKKPRALDKIVPRQEDTHPRSPELVVFYEKTTGAIQFRAKPETDLSSSVDRFASLLAMQCLVRGHNPDDLMVLVPAEPSLVERLISRARDLLDEGRAIPTPASLSPRQKEVLHSVICNKANKEIASKLNITVRTVKFHISTLLSKFGVQSRSELARRAAGLVRPGTADTPEYPEVESERRGLGPIPVKSDARVGTSSRNIRFAGRILTA
jgi:DNA-binding NarL/FixJ family response regulator